MKELHIDRSSLSPGTVVKISNMGHNYTGIIICHHPVNSDESYWTYLYSKSSFFGISSVWRPPVNIFTKQFNSNYYWIKYKEIVSILNIKF